MEPQTNNFFLSGFVKKETTAALTPTMMKWDLNNQFFYEINYKIKKKKHMRENLHLKLRIYIFFSWVNSICNCCPLHISRSNHVEVHLEL